MSSSLTQAQITEFDADVKGAYQMSGKLRSKVRVKPGIVGSTTTFQRSGKGVAKRRLPQTDVIPMNAGYTPASATLTDWCAPEYTDVFDQQKTNIQEKPVVAANIAAAIGRREDQLILDALDAANAAAQVDTNVGGAGTGLNMAKLLKAKQLLDDAGVPETERTFLHSAVGMNQLLNLTQVTSTDYNSVQALVKGELKTFLGMDFIMIETRSEGGLPLAGGLRTNYAFHGGKMGSMGLAIGIDFKTEVNYIPEKTSWLANGLFSSGAVAIDANGVIEISSTEP